MGWVHDEYERTDDGLSGNVRFVLRHKGEWGYAGRKIGRAYTMLKNRDDTWKEFNAKQDGRFVRLFINIDENSKQVALEKAAKRFAAQFHAHNPDPPPFFSPHKRWRHYA